jgi:hypothetical protein
VVKDDQMTTRAALGIILGISTIGLAGYGLGSGWLRLGPPERAQATRDLPEFERAEDPRAVAGGRKESAPRLDDLVSRTRRAGTATKIAAILEPDPAATGTPVYSTGDFTAGVPLRSNHFWVRTQPIDPNAVLNMGNVPGSYSTALQLFEFNLSTLPQPPVGRQTLALLNATGSTVLHTVPVIIPDASPLSVPVIEQASNARYVAPTAVLNDANAKPLNVFGTYMRITGHEGPANYKELSFYIYVKQGNYFEYNSSQTAAKPTQPGTQAWAEDLTLPIGLAAGQDVRVFAVNTPQSNPRFSAMPLRVRHATSTLDSNTVFPIERVGVYLAAPTKDNPGGVKAQTYADKPAYFYANKSDITFRGTAGLKEDTYALVFLDNSQTPFAVSSPTLPNVQAGEWWTGPLDLAARTLLEDNMPHSARVALIQGDLQSRFSEPVTIQVSTVGPKLDSIGVSSPGPDLGVQQLSVHFVGNALNKDKAEDITNYSLQPADPTQPAVRPTSAKFDSDRNSVDLQFSALKPTTYTLVLITNPPGSKATVLTDIYNNPIKDKTMLAVQNTQDGGTVDGIPKPEKAPNAVFPEFNQPRPESNGFNPSDHVDTRVSRLYFYRDARRVAEIINRDLKSYNQAAVDTRRRLAEKARTDADTLTDQRRLQEVKAVRAAGATREAQRRVDQAQAAVNQNQATANNAGPTLSALQLQQSQLQQQLDQAKLAAAPPPPAPGTTTPPPADDAATQQRNAAARSVATLTDKLNGLNAQISQIQDQSTEAKAQAQGLNNALAAAQSDLQSARQNEADKSDDVVKDQAQEDRARENQFRLEVAAAHEDPNSYVPGQPDSIDPVLQVSISVIGEGLIQLRGPIKGINIIRRMINEIDTPAGQVRIALHTIQINGEHEDRLEKVAGRIQAYVDHSRFLTVQSSQMLRNAVVKVASRKAEEARAALPPEQAADEKLVNAQAFRDRKYQESFFGVDFINELHLLDSEFLHTGNKLLSLHSMDTTSLASALFMIALAKNDTRMEILEEFKMMLEGELPEAENTFELSSGRTGKEHHHNVLPLAQNARFQSFIGLFNAEVAGNDTLNPLQREFIKLAQILKSRLVVELEYKQRFLERGLIEDRIGNYLQELKEQQIREEKAKKAREHALEKVTLQRDLINQKLEQVAGLLNSERSLIARVRDDITATQTVVSHMASQNRQAITEKFVADQRAEAERKNPGQLVQPEDFAAAANRLFAPDPKPRTPAEAEAEVERLTMQEVYLKQVDGAKFTYMVNGQDKWFKIESDRDGTISKGDNQTTDDDLAIFTRHLNEWIDTDTSVRELLSNLAMPPFLRNIQSQAFGMLDHIATKDLMLVDPSTGKQTGVRKATRHLIFEHHRVLTIYTMLLSEVQRFIRSLEQLAREVNQNLTIDQSTSGPARQRWQWIREDIQNYYQGRFLKSAQPLIDAIDIAFDDFQNTQAAYQSARRIADESRRPLDTKKLLDLLIDEIEDQYIELLEGIRSHTANIDGYVKGIATALDDDFNNQFYYPAFKEIRKSSSYWDVELGQVETTNILTNNRMFAKVEPQATMEFDLPKRDILINEAMNGAKALMDSYGALVADPSFLALTKMQSGQPTSSPAQGFGSGGNTVRNVLPGLPRSNDEQLLSQAPAGRKEFGAPLEALIPDPAIYKFETGTGFELRPVIQPDGQSVVFHLEYMYTTNVREPVRADEKHLGRIKRHFIDTEVQLGNYELREVSRYQVALKASRTGRGVPLLEDIPGLGILFRPLPNASSSLQQNVILGQSTIFPTLFDLMGLRIAQTVADLDTLRTRNSEFVVRGRQRDVMNRVFDYSTSRVDEYLRVPPAERRADLYRSQETIPNVHPGGYRGPGLNLQDSQLQEGYDPTRANPPNGYTPADSRDNAPPESNDHDTARPDEHSWHGHDFGGAPAAAAAPNQPGMVVPGAAPPGVAAPGAVVPGMATPGPTLLGPEVSRRHAPVRDRLASDALRGASRAAIPRPADRSASQARGAAPAASARTVLKQPAVAPNAPQTKAALPSPRVANQPVRDPAAVKATAALPSPRVANRPVRDPAAVKATAALPQPAPAKPPRKSVLSRIFKSNQ